MSTKDTRADTQELSIEQEPGKRNGNHEHEHEHDFMQAPKVYRFTEFGNAERMIDAYGQDIRYNQAFGFIYWDGKRWVMDSDILVESLAWETIRRIYHDASYYNTLASQCSDDDKRKDYGEKAKKLTSWALHSETRNMVTAMLKLVRSRAGIFMKDTHLFDNHLTSIYKLNFQNGTLDMTPNHWKFYAHKREDYLTNLLAFSYTPYESACKLTFDYRPYTVYQTGYLFDAFLENVTCGNGELARYIQKALGLSLTGYTKEEAWFLLIGQGENGKTTLFDLIVHIMGEYAIRVDAKTIEASNANKGGSNATPDIARLKGKRLAVIAETEEGAVLATSRLKDMATGEQVTARFLNRDNFQFYQTHKVFIYTNHLPQVRDTSHGFWRRVGYIPFDYTVPANKKDRDLIFKMQKEAEYVLAWMIEGERLRQLEGMEKPQIVQLRTSQYRESQDIIAQFVRENCVVDEHEQVAASIFQAAFKEWMSEEMGFNRPLTMQAVKRMMLDHGFTHKHTREGKIYTGLRMRAANEPIPESVTVTDYDRNSEVKKITDTPIELHSESPSQSVTGHTLSSSNEQEPDNELEKCTNVQHVQHSQVKKITDTPIEFHSEKGTSCTFVQPTNEQETVMSQADQHHEQVAASQVQESVRLPHCQHWKCGIGPNRTIVRGFPDSPRLYCEGHNGYIDEQGKPF